jgi:putative membrane-bound dehydrogenase-like protein
MTMPRLPVAVSMFALALAASAVHAQSPAAPDPALPKCPPDWKVELVAAPPNLRHPSVVCCAPDGRVFVAEDPMDMGNDSTIPTDRILCFHPDGKVTVFAEQLGPVFGLAYVDGKVYVHHCPKFSVFTDDNGVGKDRKDLIPVTNPKPNTGFNDHIPANMRLGMDGWFYMATGDKGIFGATGLDGSKAEIHGGGVMRFRPDGTKLEVFSTGTRNHLDVAVNAEDELFTYDNTDDGNGWWTRVTHMVDGGFYGYPYDYKPRRPYTLWMMTDFGGGSPCGAIAYNEDALPAEYRGNVFLCEWGRGQLIRLQVSREGGTYKIDKRTDVLTRGKEEFRPVGIAVTPDGMGFYVADWNYGGWKSKQVAGRLLKFTFTGKSEAYPKPAWYVPAASGKPFTATTIELADALKHPAQSVRMVAQRRLIDRGAEAVEPLAKLATDATAPAHARWHAIWALDAVEQGKGEIRWGLLQDPDASVRRQFARALGDRGVKFLNAVEPLLKDADASVRFQAAAALGRTGNAVHVDPLLRALDDKDLFARYAVFTALHRIGMADDKAWAAVARGLGSENPAVREGTLFAFRDAYGEGAVAALAGFVAEAKNPSEVRAAALLALAEIARKRPAWDGRWWGTQPVKGSPAPKTVDWAGTPAALKAVRAALDDADAAVRTAAVDAVRLSRDDESLPRLLSLITAKGAAPAVQAAALKAVGDLKIAPESPANEVLEWALGGNGLEAAVQAEAVRAAGKAGTPKAVAALIKFVAADAPAEALVAAMEQLAARKTVKAVPAIAARVNHADAKVRAAAITALGAMGGDAAAEALIPLLSDKSPETRRSAVAALGSLKNPKAVEPLVKAFADPETRFEATSALAATPDLRALDAYVAGLAGKNGTVRDACRKAVTVIRNEALPLLEARAGKTGPEGLPPEAVAELRKIYAGSTPVAEWQFAGPFDDDGKDLTDPAALAHDKLPDLKKADGKPVKWKKGKIGSDGAVDLHKVFGGGWQCMCYAVASVESPLARDAELTAGADDALAVWVNGKKVFDNLGRQGGFKADEFKFKARLEAGRNVIVAKVANGGGGWAFAVSVPGVATGKLFEAPAATRPDIREYESFALKYAGDVEHGRALFSDLKGVACLKCHVYKTDADVSATPGPNLAGVGAKYDKAKLIESVLFPSKQILDGYQQTIIRTEDGVVLAGIVRVETADELTLVDAEGKKHVLKKSAIEARKASEKSLMPDGLHQGLTPKDFADVIAFLESLKEGGKK